MLDHAALAKARTVRAVSDQHYYTDLFPQTAWAGCDKTKHGDEDADSTNEVIP